MANYKKFFCRKWIPVLLSVVCIVLTVIRWIVTKNARYFFLNWNLLLASVPWFISLFIFYVNIRKKPKLLFAPLFFLWLLFFPNAPYIVTDLIYVKNLREPMLWYDVIMLFLFAWTGLLFGFFSLEKIESVLAGKLTQKKCFVVSVCILFAAAFGIFLGRDLRWNSWDIVLEPKEFILDVLDRFIKPLSHGRTWGFTLVMGLFLNIFYWSLKKLQKNE